MALSRSTVIRAGVADDVAYDVADARDAGAGANGSLAIRNTSDTPVDPILLNFENPAFGSARNGVVTLPGTPIATTALASGRPIASGPGGRTAS